MRQEAVRRLRELDHQTAQTSLCQLQRKEEVKAEKKRFDRRNDKDGTHYVQLAFDPKNKIAIRMRADGEKLVFYRVELTRLRSSTKVEVDKAMVLASEEYRLDALDKIHYGIWKFLRVGGEPLNEELLRALCDGIVTQDGELVFS